MQLFTYKVYSFSLNRCNRTVIKTDNIKEKIKKYLIYLNTIEEKLALMYLIKFTFS